MHVEASTMTDELGAGIEKKYLFNEENLRNDDKKVKFYTGFPSFKRLRAVYINVSKDIIHGCQAGLTLFQQFIMVLLKTC